MSQYTHLGGAFWKSATGVFCEWRPLKLDPAKVKVYFGTWATDGEQVYRDVFSKPKIDAKTFVALNYVYAKDAIQCYCECVQVQKVIPKADPTTFVVLDSGCEKLMRGLGSNHSSGYAKDREHVYFNGNALKKADPSTFVSLGGCFGRDASNIYFEDGRLPNADRQLWRRIGGNYSCDEKHVFWQHKVIKDAVPFDFRQIDPFDDDYAYDGRYFYCRNDKISQDEYVDALKSTEEGLGSLAENCSTGKWQQIMYGYDRYYREPDETLYRMERVELDQWLTAVEKNIGPGEPFPFKSLHQFIRAFNKLRGEVDDDDEGDEEEETADRRDLRSWRHQDNYLVCEVEKGKIQRSCLFELTPEEESALVAACG